MYDKTRPKDSIYKTQKQEIRPHKAQNILRKNKGKLKTLKMPKKIHNSRTQMTGQT